MDHGHTSARLYPLPVVWSEVKIVRDRLNQEIASNASLTQLVIASILSKKAGGKLQKRLKDLIGG